MTNPMLAELDEVVRLIAKEEKEEAGKPLSILRDNEELDNACYWFMKNHHATLADMAKRLEAAERDSKRLDALLQAMGEYDREGWNDQANPVAWARERAAEILAGWLREE